MIVPVSSSSCFSFASPQIVPAWISPRSLTLLFAPACAWLCRPGRGVRLDVACLRPGRCRSSARLCASFCHCICLPTSVSPVCMPRSLAHPGWWHPGCRDPPTAPAMAMASARRAPCRAAPPAGLARWGTVRRLLLLLVPLRPLRWPSGRWAARPIPWFVLAALPCPLLPTGWTAGAALASRLGAWLPGPHPGRYALRAVGRRPGPATGASIGGAILLLAPPTGVARAPDQPSAADGPSACAPSERQGLDPRLGPQPLTDSRPARPSGERRARLLQQQSASGRQTKAERPLPAVSGLTRTPQAPSGLGEPGARL